MKKFGFVFVLVFMLIFGAVFTACNEIQEVLTYEVVGNDGTVYYVDDDFSFDGYKLVIRSNLVKDVVEVDLTSDIVATLPDMKTAGEKTIVFTYKGKTYSFKIEVEEKTEKIESVRNLLNDFFAKYKEDGKFESANVTFDTDLVTKYFGQEVENKKSNVIIDYESFGIDKSVLPNYIFNNIVDSLIKSSEKYSNKEIENSKELTFDFNEKEFFNNFIGNMEDFDYYSYVLEDVIFVKDKYYYVDYLTKFVGDLFALNEVGRENINDLISVNFTKFLNKKEVDFEKITERIVDIVKKYSFNEYAKGFVEVAYDEAKNYDEHILSAFFEKYLIAESKDYVLIDTSANYDPYNPNYDVVYDSSLRDYYVSEIIENRVAIVYLLEDYLKTNDIVTLVKGVKSCFNNLKVISVDLKNKNYAICNKQIGKLLLNNELYYSAITSFLSSNGAFVDYLKQNELVELLFKEIGRYTNLPKVIQDEMVKFVYDLLYGNEIDFEKYIADFAQIFDVYTKEQIEEYVEDLKTNGYTTILSDYLSTLEYQTEEQKETFLAFVKYLEKVPAYGLQYEEVIDLTYDILDSYINDGAILSPFKLFYNYYKNNMAGYLKSVGYVEAVLNSISIFYLEDEQTQMLANYIYDIIEGKEIDFEQFIKDIVEKFDIGTSDDAEDYIQFYRTNGYTTVLSDYIVENFNPSCGDEEIDQKLKEDVLNLVRYIERLTVNEFNFDEFMNLGEETVSSLYDADLIDDETIIVAGIIDFALTNTYIKFIKDNNLIEVVIASCNFGLDDESVELLASYVYEIIDGNKIDYEQLIEDVAGMLGVFTSEQIEEYFEDFKQNGYTTILSDYLSTCEYKTEEAKDSVVALVAYLEKLLIQEVDYKTLIDLSYDVLKATIEDGNINLIVDLLNSYYNNNLVEYLKENQIIEGMLYSYYPSFEEEQIQILADYVYDIIDGKEIDYIQLVKDISDKFYFLTNEEIDEYIEQFELNGYTTIISDLISYYYNLTCGDEEIDNELKQNILNFVKYVEQLTVNELDFDELMGLGEEVFLSLYKANFIDDATIMTAGVVNSILTNTYIEFIEENDLIAVALYFGCNLNYEYAEMISNHVYYILENNNVDFEQVIKDIANLTGSFSAEEVEEYIEDFRENGYTTILSDYLKSESLEALSEDNKNAIIAFFEYVERIPVDGIDSNLIDLTYDLIETQLELVYNSNAEVFGSIKNIIDFAYETYKNNIVNYLKENKIIEEIVNTLIEEENDAKVIVDFVYDLLEQNEVDYQKFIVDIAGMMCVYTSEEIEAYLQEFEDNGYTTILSDYLSTLEYQTEEQKESFLAFVQYLEKAPVYGLNCDEVVDLTYDILTSYSSNGYVDLLVNVLYNYYYNNLVDYIKQTYLVDLLVRLYVEDYDDASLIISYIYDLLDQKEVDYEALVLDCIDIFTDFKKEDLEKYINMLKQDEIDVEEIVLNVIDDYTSVKREDVEKYLNQYKENGYVTILSDLIENEQSLANYPKFKQSLVNLAKSVEKITTGNVDYEEILSYTFDVINQAVKFSNINEDDKSLILVVLESLENFGIDVDKISKTIVENYQTEIKQVLTNYIVNLLNVSENETAKREIRTFVSTSVYDYLDNNFSFENAFENFNNIVNEYCDDDTKAYVRSIESMIALYYGNNNNVDYNDLLKYVELPEMIESVDYNKFISKLSEDQNFDEMFKTRNVLTKFIIDEENNIVGESLVVVIDIDFDIVLTSVNGSVSFSFNVIF